MQKYCVLQERCHQEVYHKLRSLHLGHDASNQIIAELISDGFLNEERFAKAFAQGKFRMNKWGKIKIRTAMKHKNVAEKCIELGLAVIGEEEYQNQLKKIITQYIHQRRLDISKFKNIQKIYRYALSKGYENHLISNILHELPD